MLEMLFEFYRKEDWLNEHALAIDNPAEYARLYLDGTMQMWIDAEDSLELW